MIVLAQVSSQIEGIECISVVVVPASYEQSFVFAQLSSSSKKTVVGSYIQSVFVIRLYGSDGVLLLTIQIEYNLAQVEMLKIERFTFNVTVECLIGYEADNYARKTISRNSRTDNAAE